jgi:hypothetical protein
MMRGPLPASRSLMPEAAQHRSTDELHMAAATLDLNLALLDPAAVFPGPEDVVMSQELTIDQKRDILQRWRYGAVELAVASDEGMAGPENGLHSRILAALRQLDAAERETRI